jgi:hypothetical protein
MMVLRFTKKGVVHDTGSEPTKDAVPIVVAELTRRIAKRAPDPLLNYPSPL